MEKEVAFPKVDLETLESLRAEMRAATPGNIYLATWAFESALVGAADSILAELRELRSKACTLREYGEQAFTHLRHLGLGLARDSDWPDIDDLYEAFREELRDS